MLDLVYLMLSQEIGWENIPKMTLAADIEITRLTMNECFDIFCCWLVLSWAWLAHAADCSGQ